MHNEVNTDWDEVGFNGLSAAELEAKIEMAEGGIEDRRYIIRDCRLQLARMAA
jgi:hypothetical protein